MQKYINSYIFCHYKVVNEEDFVPHVDGRKALEACAVEEHARLRIKLSEIFQEPRIVETEFINGQRWGARVNVYVQAKEELTQKVAEFSKISGRKVYIAPIKDLYDLVGAYAGHTFPVLGYILPDSCQATPLEQLQGEKFEKYAIKVRYGIKAWDHIKDMHSGSEERLELLEAIGRRFEKIATHQLLIGSACVRNRYWYTDGEIVFDGVRLGGFSLDEPSTIFCNTLNAIGSNSSFDQSMGPFYRNLDEARALLRLDHLEGIRVNYRQGNIVFEF